MSPFPRPPALGLTRRTFVAVLGLGGAQRVVDARLSKGPVALSGAQQRILQPLRLRDRLTPWGPRKVRAALSGRFTRPGALQQAFLFIDCLTQATQASRRDFARLVIYEQGRIVRTLKNIGDGISNAGDLNGDGMEDLVFMTDHGPERGRYWVNASVVTLSYGTFRTFIHLDQVECGRLRLPGLTEHSAAGHEVGRGVKCTPGCTVTRCALACADPNIGQVSSSPRVVCMRGVGHRSHAGALRLHAVGPAAQVVRWLVPSGEQGSEP